MNKENQYQTFRVTKIIIEVAVLLFAVAIAWTTLRGDVKRNTGDIEKQEVRIGSVEGDVGGIKTDIREIKTTQSHIAEDIGKIEEKMK